MKELLLGSGSRKVKDLSMRAGSREFENVTTLDYNKDHKPDVVWDLRDPVNLPFDDNTFDEIHAYEVLEHIAQQGDYHTFFRQFSDYYRVLKPDGLFFATCPAWNGKWAWGDPSHTRVIQEEHLAFLNQQEYINQVGITSMSDFRNIYKADFETVWHETRGDRFAFVLQAVKPSRINRG